MDNMISDSEDQLQETLGQLLKKSRTRQKKSLKDAAEDTKIHIPSLQALEDDNFTALPAEVFVRGFIKLYAEYLGLDPEDTIKHYISQDNTDPEDPTITPHQRDILKGATLAESTSFLRNNGKIITVSMLLAILLLFYGLGVFFKSSPPLDDLQPGLDITSSPANEIPPTDQQNNLTTIEEKELEQEGTVADQAGQKKEDPAAPPVISTPPAETSHATPTTEAGKQTHPKPVSTEVPAPAETPGLSGLEPPAKSIRENNLPRTVKVATKPPTTDSHDKLTNEFKYFLEAEFNENSLVTIKVDDQPQRQYDSQAGIVRIWKARKSIVLKLDNRNGVILTLNDNVLAPNNKKEATAVIRIPEDITDSQQP
jgi:cytoskeleton protein RodZ